MLIPALRNGKELMSLRIWKISSFVVSIEIYLQHGVITIGLKKWNINIWQKDETCKHK